MSFFLSGFLLKLLDNINPDRSLFVCVSDSSGSTEDSGPDQTPDHVSHTASTLRCRCHGITALLPSPPRLKLEPRPVSESAPPPGAPAPSPWTPLFNTHTGSVFPLLTLAKLLSALNCSSKQTWDLTKMRYKAVLIVRCVTAGTVGVTDLNQRQVWMEEVKSGNWSPNFSNVFAALLFHSSSIS